MSEYPDIDKLLNEKAAQVSDTRGKRLEFLAFAFLSETGFKPSECELVQQNVGNEIRFFYRKRETIPQAVADSIAYLGRTYGTPPTPITEADLTGGENSTPSSTAKP